MAFLAKNDGPTFTIIPEETYNGVCIGCWDCGQQRNKISGKLQHKVYLEWELDYKKEDGTAYRVGRLYTLSLYELASFRQLLESWYGTKITKEQEEMGFDPRKLVGRAAAVQIVHGAGSGANVGKKYANVQTVTKLMKGVTPYQPTAKLITYSIDDDGNNIPEQTSKYVRGLIEGSVGWGIDIKRPSDDSEDVEPNFPPDGNDEPPF
jgi:hypothetical protein